MRQMAARHITSKAGQLYIECKMNGTLFQNMEQIKRF
jgi:hypothetical protein